MACQWQQFAWSFRQPWVKIPSISLTSPPLQKTNTL